MACCGTAMYMHVAYLNISYCLLSNFPNIGVIMKGSEISTCIFVHIQIEYNHCYIFLEQLLYSWEQLVTSIGREGGNEHTTHGSSARRGSRASFLFALAIGALFF